MTSQIFQKQKGARGFTLIEILIVIGIIAILAAIVIIAINPAKQFAQARNTQRESGINTILNAIGQRTADNKGVFAGEFDIDGHTYKCGVLPSPVKDITSDNAANTTSETGDLGCLVPTYIATFPMDPKVTGGSNTGYTVELLATGRVKVCSPNAGTETAIPGAEEICVTR